MTDEIKQSSEIPLTHVRGSDNSRLLLRAITKIEETVSVPKRKRVLDISQGLVLAVFGEFVYSQCKKNRGFNLCFLILYKDFIIRFHFQRLS